MHYFYRVNTFLTGVLKIMSWVKLQGVIGPECEINRKGEIRQSIVIERGVVKRNVLKVPSVGYNKLLYVTFRQNGRQQNRYVHRLVAETFVPNPYRLRHIHIIDGISFHCFAENLEWCDTPPHRRGIRQLTESDVLEIRERIARGDKGTAIAFDYKVDASLISQIKHGTKWSDVR